MRIVRLTVDHPVTTTMVFVALLVFGLMGLWMIPQDLFPNVELPTVAIFTSYPGVGSFEMESSVTKPVEAAVATVNNVSSISSQSSEGVSFVTVGFTWAAKLDTVVADVREKLNSIENDLPEGAKRPVLFKFSASSLPVMGFNINGDNPDIDYRRLAQDLVVPALEKLDSVAQVRVFGGRRAAVMVKVGVDSLANSDVSLLQVVQMFKQENLNFPAGALELKDRYLVMRTIGAFDSIDDVGSVLVGYKGSVPIFLKDIAEIRLDYLPQDEFVRAGGKTGVYVSVQKMPGTNAVAIAKAVRAELDRLKAEALPPSVRIAIQSDQSVTVVDSIRGLGESAWQGGLLAVLVLLLFLRNWRSTLIVAFVIPMSIFTIFGPMVLLGISLNITSLLGLSLGVGMLVDNSVVIIETVYRKRLQGMSMRDAAVEGTSEVGMSLLAATASSVAVFAPLLFVKGMVGQLFRDMTFAIAYTQFISLLMAITLMPVLCARYLKMPAGLRMATEKMADPHYELSLADMDIVFGNKWLDRPLAAIRGFMSRMDDAYERLLAPALRRPALVFAGGILLLGASVGTVLVVGMEFLPETDEGAFSIQIETAVGSPFAYTAQKVIDAERITQGYIGQYITAMTSEVGTGTGIGNLNSGSNLGAISIVMVGKNQRPQDIWTIVRTLERRLNGELPGVRATLSIDSMSALANVAAGDSAPIVIELTGTDLDSMAAWGRKIAARVATVSGTRNAALDYTEGKPELQLVIDREQALTLGFTPYEIAASLRMAFTGIEVSTFRVGDRDTPIHLMLRGEDRVSIERLKQLTFVNRAGTRVSLETIVKVQEGFGPLTIERKNRARIVKVTAFLTGEAPLNRVNADIGAAIAAMGPAPPGITLSNAGSEKQMDEAFSSLTLVLLISLMLVYMVMAAQFENLLHPFIIMFSIPFAAIGMIGMLLLTNTTFNLMAFVGAILLVGYVVSNGIVLLDYISTLRERGMPLREAVLKGGRTRLKPIIMSVSTSLIGMVPLAIGLGTGSELQSPMARAVFGGLFSSTAVTLVLIPTIYYVIESAKERRAARRGL
jgi:HAE1 family hydrophobic/amphiphilic exporter-1